MVRSVVELGFRVLFVNKFARLGLVERSNWWVKQETGYITIHGYGIVLLSRLTMAQLAPRHDDMAHTTIYTGTCATSPGRHRPCVCPT